MQLLAKCVAIAFVIVLLGASAVGVALARNNSTTPSTGTTAPIGSAYVQYKQDEAAGKVVTHTVGGYPLGYEPPPLELSQPVSTAAVPSQQRVQEPH
jgi:hypothetical protein